MVLAANSNSVGVQALDSILAALSLLTVTGIGWMARYLAMLGRSVAALTLHVMPEDKPPIDDQIEHVRGQVELVRARGSDRLDAVLTQARRNQRASIAAACVAFVAGWVGSWVRYSALLMVAPRRRRRLR